MYGTAYAGRKVCLRVVMAGCANVGRGGERGVRVGGVRGPGLEYFFSESQPIVYVDSSCGVPCPVRAVGPAIQILDLGLARVRVLPRVHGSAGRRKRGHST